MKKIILSAIVFLFSVVIADAQASGSGGASKTNAGGGKSDATKNVKKHTGNKKNTTQNKKTTTQLNQRKMYQWSDGQRATPTGDQATGVNGDSYMAGKKDTAHIKKNVQKQ